MNSTEIPRLVVILDRAGSRGAIDEVAAAAIQGGADIVQIREKQSTEAEVAELTRQMIAAVGRPELIAVNGFPAVAAECGTHLHLPEHVSIGWQDTELAQGRLVSQSIHGPAPEFAEDYAILGNLHETDSKPGRPGLGLESFAQIAGNVPRPVLAIGGITPNDLRSILKLGGWGVAVRSYIIGSPDPERAAREFRVELDKWAK
jgi:thiamine-phosphate diphosphorylase